MKWSSGSTSRAAFFFALLGLGVFAGGCARRAPAPLPPPLRGSVDLDQLVRRHPGWGGVGQYDAALRRLSGAARSLPPAARADEKIAVLPALPAPAASEVGTAGAEGAGIARRLAVTQQSLLDGLRARRGMARSEEIEGRRDTWRKAARALFPPPPLPAVGGPDLEIQLLEADVAALTRTVTNWKPSPPPAPRLEAVKDLLARNEARLAALRADREAARLEAQARFEVDRQRARAARVAYVQSQAQSLEGQLRGDDDRLIGEQAARLSRQRTALVSSLAQPVALAVPTIGYAGAETLPHGPGAAQARLSAASLALAQARLRAQRARWVEFLYDDTQAAAQDVAGQRRWDVTFGPPRRGDRDLTAAMAQAMAGSVWRL